MIIKNKKIIFQIVLILALIVLTIPGIVKTLSGNTTFIGEESYYHIRMIDQFRDYGLKSTEVLTDKPYSFNLFHASLSLLPKSEIFIKIIPLILGLASLVILVLLFTKMNISADDSIFSIIVIILSPIFIYTFTTFTPDSLAFFLLALGFLLFINRNYLSAIVFSALVLTNFMYGISVLLILIAYNLIKKKFDADFYVNSAAIILTTIFALIFLDYNLFVQFTPITTSLNNLFVSFSAIKGYSFFIVILAIIGFKMDWKRSFKQTLIYSFIASVFILSVLYPALRILVNSALAVYAGIAISKFIKDEWNVKKLKGITLLLIICSLLFSTAVFLKAEITEINPKKVEAINYLTATDKGDIILSSVENGFLIETLANRIAYLDSNSYKFSDYEEKVAVAKSIYYSRSLDKLKTILNSNKINHILVDNKMRTGGIWNTREEGILLLFDNSKSFVKIFDNKEVQIYRYVGQELKN